MGACAGFWKRYLASLPADHPHRSARPDAFAFGDSDSLANQLAALVVSGKKQATASLAIEFTSLNEPVPKAGDPSIVLWAGGLPAAIIEHVEVRHVAFQSVDEAFAASEGEGDCTLAWWRAAHREYFSRVCQRLGGEFNETTPVICQRFRLVWKEDVESLARDHGV